MFTAGSFSETIASRRGGGRPRKPIGAADRQRQVQFRQQRDLQIKLTADVGELAANSPVVEIRGQRRAKTRRPEPGGVEAGRAQPRGIARAAGSTRVWPSAKLRPPISFSSTPGKLSTCAIALLVTVIDVVVAESAKEEVGERLRPIRAARTAGGPDPHRGMPERQADAAVVTCRAASGRRRRRRRRCCGLDHHLLPVSSSTSPSELRTSV